MATTHELGSGRGARPMLLGFGRGCYTQRTWVLLLLLLLLLLFFVLVLVLVLVIIIIKFEK